MSDEIKLTINDDGIAEIYDDTWDITIHCISEEEMNANYKRLKEAVFKDQVDKMKSEIADALEFWNYEPSKNLLVRDILESITKYCGEIKNV